MQTPRFCQRQSRRFPASLVPFLFAIAATTGDLSAEDRSAIAALPSTLQEKFDHFHRLDVPRSEASLAFFSGLNRAELRQLAQTDLAIRAAWEAVRREKHSETSVDEFLNTVRQKLAIEPPKWWVKVIQEAQPRPTFPLRAGTAHTYQFEINPKLLPQYDHHPGDWFLPLGQTIRTSSGQTVIQMGKQKVLVPEAVMERKKRLDYSHCLVADIATDSQGGSAYFVCHADIDSDFPLYRVNLASGEIVWEAEIRMHGVSIARLGVQPPPSRRGGDLAITIMRDSDRVLIFGASSGYANVEVFCESNGKSLSRFCTIY